MLTPKEENKGEKERKKQQYSLKSPQSSLAPEMKHLKPVPLPTCCISVRRGHNQQSQYRAPTLRTLAPAT
jgi:hypothetical protein